jgi:hypothetical protein
VERAGQKFLPRVACGERSRGSSQQRENYLRKIGESLGSESRGQSVIAFLFALIKGRWEQIRPRISTYVLLYLRLCSPGFRNRQPLTKVQRRDIRTHYQPVENKGRRRG